MVLCLLFLLFACWYVIPVSDGLLFVSVLRVGVVRAGFVGVFCFVNSVSGGLLVGRVLCCVFMFVSFVRVLSCYVCVCWFCVRVCCVAWLCVWCFSSCRVL